MSATTASTAAGVQTPAATTTSAVTGRIHRSAGPAALVLGSVLTIGGMSLHAEGLPNEAFVRTVESQPTQWLTSHLALAFGMALLAAGITTVRRLTRERRTKLTTVGTAVTAVGAVLMSLGDLAHGAVAYALVGHLDTASSLAAQEAYFSQPAIAVVSMGGMLLPLGLLILSIGLLRSRLIPRWVGIVLLVRPIAIQAGMASGPRMLAFGLPFVIGLAALARETAAAGSRTRLT